jgi:SAM-dependent methyltransferase
MELDYDFTRYLAAKKTVDDRALNKDVWRQLQHALPNQPDILEIGAGIGTMVERLIAEGLVQNGRYTAIDNQSANIDTARSRLSHLPPDLSLTLEAIDVFDFAAREQGKRAWDVLIAHAFLDLMDIPAALPILLSLLKPGGLCYFTINFDGVTSLEPAIKPALDALIERLYHQSMNERMTNGRYSGDSRSGRHLFTHLRQNNIDILAAGSSDWVVFVGEDGYPADEAYFLHFIIHFFEQALHDHPQLDAFQFQAWLDQRHAQIEAGELVYIAHQIDFLGRKN